MSARGFAIVALDNPKTPSNIGGAFRAAHVYRAAGIALGGKRPKGLGHCVTDTTKAYRHIPLTCVDDVFDALPYDTVPVAVEIVEGGHPLPSYAHPQRAFYIFGAEDATLGKRILDRCRDKIFVPTQFCMNLAATVNVVLYDRMCKGSAT